MKQTPACDKILMIRSGSHYIANSLKTGLLNIERAWESH